MARSAWIKDRWSGSNGNGSKFSGKVGYPGTLGTLKSGQTFLIWVRFSMTSLITSVTSEWERFRSCLTSESLWSIDISPVPWWSLRRYVIEWQSIIHHIYPIGVSKFDAYLIISWFIRTLQLPFLLENSGWDFHPSGHQPPGGSPTLLTLRFPTSGITQLGRSHSEIQTPRSRHDMLFHRDGHPPINND